MQTFIPFPDYAKSAAVLDRQRLGKQRVEAFQIAKCLAGIPSSWKNHPAVVMWRPYPGALLRYQEAVCKEWTDARHYNDTCLESTREVLLPIIVPFDLSDQQPWWFGDETFHASHRSNLYRKDPKFYADFADEDDLPYRWPTAEAGVWK